LAGLGGKHRLRCRAKPDLRGHDPPDLSRLSCQWRSAGLAVVVGKKRRELRDNATTIQLVEADRLCNPDGKPDSKSLRGGIEIDAYGAPRAYYIRKSHPGDVCPGFGATIGDWERVPATTAFGRRRVLHIHDKKRSGQHRGKPLLTSIMPMFKMLDHYERSELQAAVVNAMIAAFIVFGGSIENYLAARNEWDARLQGGSIIPVFPGDKVAPFTPSRPNNGYGQFVENVLRHIGTGLNIPFELLMNFRATAVAGDLLGQTRL